VAYDESLANGVRAALGNTRHVQERRMFGGLVFMVRGKMCVSVGKERIMCRLCRLGLPREVVVHHLGSGQHVCFAELAVTAMHMPSTLAPQRRQ
jgi:hypothetical protein